MLYYSDSENDTNICGDGRPKGHAPNFHRRKLKFAAPKETLLNGKAAICGSSTNDPLGEDDTAADAHSPERRTRKTTSNQVPPALLAFSALSSYVQLGRSSLYALISNGAFPLPIKIGKSSRWLKSEVDAWLEMHVAARKQMNGGK